MNLDQENFIYYVEAYHEMFLACEQKVIMKPNQIKKKRRTSMFFHVTSFTMTFPENRNILSPTIPCTFS